MASGSVDEEFNWRGTCKWTENSKVYIRRNRRKAQNASNKNETAADEDPTTSEIGSAYSTQEHIEDLATDKAVSSDGRLREQSLCQDNSVKSVDGDNVSTLQQPRYLENGIEQQDSLLADENPTARETNGDATVELGSSENLLSPDSNDGNGMVKSSPLFVNEKPQTSEDRPGSERVSILLSGDNDLSNGEEPREPQWPIVNEQNNNKEVVPTPPEAPASDGPSSGNGVLKPLVVSRVEDMIRFSLSKATARNEIMELRKKLGSELDRVRELAKEVETSELRLASAYNTQVSTSLIKSSYISAEGANVDSYSQPTSHALGELYSQPASHALGEVYSQPASHALGDMMDRRLLVRMNSELSGTGHLEHRPKGLARVSSDVGAVRNLAQRPYSRQLTVAVMENDRMAGEFMEKEKRTPKANQYYRNSEFLLGKDRLPPESNKRLKTNNGRKYSRDARHGGFGLGYDKSMKQVFKNCSSLLQRLMKHKHGWVFNEPVNAKALGLVDYHDIIKHPMDLGTIKTRLSHNWYKSPRAFAEDVRLVFLNAMTYNPKGQDVHVMAEQLSEIFEERWAVIENEYNSSWKYPTYQEATLTTPTSRKAPPQSYLVPVSVTASAPVLTYASAPTFAPIASYAPRSHAGRTPVPKKPKAKDENKRDMTFDEKQRLSTNLERLPPEKLDAIIQIIRKRNASVSQNDDEIEVDIDRVDTETLWELDRFVTNYKKSLSKYKRKAELAMQSRMVVANQNNPAMQSNPAAAREVQVANGTVSRDRAEPHDDGGQKPGENGSRSSSSSSSSSDSGSSSSDSDSDSSSADGSDPGHSPRT